MAIEVIALLVFVLTIATVTAGYAMLTSRWDTAFRRQVEGRLREVGTGEPDADGDAASALVKTHAAGPLPTVERPPVKRRADRRSSAGSSSRVSRSASAVCS